VPRKNTCKEGVFMAERIKTCLDISSTSERVQFVVTWVANTPFKKTWHRFHDDDNNNNNKQ